MDAAVDDYQGDERPGGHGPDGRPLPRRRPPRPAQDRRAARRSTGGATGGRRSGGTDGPAAGLRRAPRGRRTPATTGDRRQAARRARPARRRPHGPRPARARATDSRSRPAEWLSHDPDVVTIRVETAAPGLLVVGNTWMPGWTATVDDCARAGARGATTGSRSSRSRGPVVTRSSCDTSPRGSTRGRRSRPRRLIVWGGSGSSCSLGRPEAVLGRAAAPRPAGT